MAQYKVPQDVEADDKLIGPFSFRQFIYLLIAGGLVALAVFLFQLFPLLVIIPLPFILFFLVLALPIKKDQPMETYLAALVSYYLKPRTRIWTPGQRESTILITAPKVVEEVRTRNISSEEATHRLSFLADIVDTEGYAIKGAGNNSMRDDLLAEANATTDMFESYESSNLQKVIQENQAAQRKIVQEGMEEERRKAEQTQREQEKRRELEEVQKRAEEEDALRRAEHKAVLERMRKAIEKGTQLDTSNVAIKNQRGSIGTGEVETKKGSTSLRKNSIMELANNKDYSVATIAKEANRIKGKDEGEIYISLH